ncbi:MAG: hypothetical protein IPG04_35320 [Polyangiaceae bacterium]|nr:hypothetical protein [Polyangiaceae bacterium]
MYAKAPLQAVAAAAFALAACETTPPENPFVFGGGGSGGESFGGGGAAVDPELGGPCVETAQCNDGVDCTVDSCDLALGRCRFHPEPAPCDNGVHCDGLEVCDGKQGCVPGPPLDCGDDNLCTIDTCVEETKSCRYEPRDADGDGDPDAHCPPGGDCDDQDPAVASTREEVCENGVDDDCDGDQDEDDCAEPQNDTCADALEIDAPGTYLLSTFGAAADYPTSCSPGGSERDVVAAIILPAGPRTDVVARARTDAADVSTAIAGQCGDAATELACGGSFTRATGGKVSRLRARGLGDAAVESAYPLTLTTDGGSSVVLEVSFEPETSPPANETCGSAEDLTPGSAIDVEIVDAAPDLSSACATTLGELVYRVQLSEASDLDLWAASADGDGQAVLSLRDADCALAEDEIACSTGLSAHVFRHSLPPGDYFIAVTATAPTTLNLLAQTSPPTAPPADESCDSGAALPPNVTLDVSFDDHQDDHLLGCFQPAVDAAYELSLDQTSDVLLVQRLSAMDSGSVALLTPGCDAPDLLSCAIGASSPVRSRRRNVAAGDYRVIAESSLGLPQQVTAFVRPYAPTTLVLFSDGCADALEIPAGGGFFQGNTSNLTANFSAGCDAAGNGPYGAKDQLLKLVLPEDKRVIFDMSGSGYDTLLDVRAGTSCPGTEVPLGCTASVASSPAYRDLLLEAGTYYVQIDGLNGATGPWVLDVHVVDP